MPRSILVLVTLCLALPPTTSRAQEHYALGPVSRIFLVTIKPGKSTDYWTDLRQNLRPLYDEYKRQGVIQGYSIGVKATTEGPDDWNVFIVLTFKNWASLDTFATKGDSVAVRFFGSYAKRSDLAAKRSEAATLVSNILVRDVTLKELPR